MNKLKERKPEYKNIFSREANIVRVDGTEGFENVIATEQPVIVFDWFEFKPIREMLLIDGVELPESKQVVLLDSHSRFQLSDIKGSTRNIHPENDERLGRVLVGTTVLAHNAEDEKQLIRDGHLTSTSIGYQVYDDYTIRIPPGKSTEVNGRVIKNEFAKRDLLVRTKWRLLENSLVAIGADSAAKFRSYFDELEDGDLERILEEKIENKLTIKLKEKKMDNHAAETHTEELKRVSAIQKLAEDFKDKVKGVDLKTVANAFVTGEKSARDFSDFILKNMVQENQSAINKPVVELAPKEIKEYSIGRAIRSLLTGENCFEAEVSREMAKKFGETKGIYVPHEGVAVKLQRDLAAGGTNTGKELVGTDLLGNQFIDYLYNKMIVSKAGVQFLTGLQGNVSIPKLSSSAGYGWAATENAALAEGTPGTLSVDLSPKRGGRYVDVSSQLLIQGNPSAERLVANDLVKSAAVALDAAILHGSGTSGQPKGVAATSGVGSVTGTSITYAGLMEFITDVETANADAETMAFITNPVIRGTFMTKPQVSGQPVYYINSNKELFGYPVYATNQVNSGYMFFGDWTQVLVGLWGGLELLVDPYTQATSGLVRLIASQFVDIAVRHPGAFSVSSNIS